MIFPKMRGSKVLMAIFFTCVIALPAAAQGYHFIYVQADGQQPFYLKYNGKNYSSSSIGYLILPKLSDGSFTVQIGFPKNVYPEQTFNLSVSGRDYGYALKNFADKGWGLFNFQTTDIVMNVNAAAAETSQTQAVVTNTSNPFGNMLADAINDSTLNQQHIVAAKDTLTKKMADSAFPSVQDSVHTVINSSAGSLLDLQPSGSTAASVVDSTMKKYINVDNEQNKTITSPGNCIVKSAESTTSGGTDITFLDNAGKDTIHAFIPSVNTMDAGKGTAVADTTAKGKTGNPFFDGSNSTTTTQQPAFIDTASATGSTTAGIVTNSNCQKMISSYDIDKLRKKIAKTESQSEIMEAIKKAMRDKCMTTEQVKDFGNLFSSDENRYNFYDAVYPFVSDYFNFPQLQSTLIDTYYKNRFKALLH